MNDNVAPDPSKIPMCYFLASGQVMFIRPGSENPEILVSNTLAITDADGRINASNIARIQQGLQRNLRSRMEDEIPKVIDVVILNISRLGVFTKEQFEAGSMLSEMNQNAQRAG